MRAESAQRTASLEFDGYGIGGLSVGETRQEMVPALAAAGFCGAMIDTRGKDGRRLTDHLTLPLQADRRIGHLLDPEYAAAALVEEARRKEFLHNGDLRQPREVPHVAPTLRQTDANDAAIDGERRALALAEPLDHLVDVFRAVRTYGVDAGPPGGRIRSPRLRRRREARREHQVAPVGEEAVVGAVLIHDGEALDPVLARPGFGDVDDARVEIAVFAGDALVDFLNQYELEFPAQSRLEGDIRLSLRSAAEMFNQEEIEKCLLLNS